MSVQHKDIVDAERHEPKGASTATIDKVYAANGAGSGTWRELPWTDTVIMADVSAPGFELIPIPQNCKIQTVEFVLYGAITVADSTVTVTRGGDGLTLGTQIISQAASAEGTTFTLTVGSNNDIISGTHKYLKIASDGASTTTAKMAITIKAKVQ